MVSALIDAARAGKVTAVVELRARFDEAANIDLHPTSMAQTSFTVSLAIKHMQILVVRREHKAFDDTHIWGPGITTQEPRAPIPTLA